MIRRAICAWISIAAAGVAAAQEDRGFTLTNLSTETVTGFFAAAPGEAEIDLLTTGSLEPEGTAEVVLPGGGGCLRNLRIVFASGATRERPDVDLCNMDGFLIE